MNRIRSDLFTDFHSPKTESLLSHHFLTHLATNIFSLGTYGCYEMTTRQVDFRLLETEKEALLDKISTLDNQWKKLETKLTNLMQEFNNWEYRFGSERRNINQEKRQLNYFKTCVQNLEKNPETLEDKSRQLKIIGKEDLPTRLRQVVLSIMTFMGNWIFTLSTLGFYSTYQNHLLRNRITILEAENQHLKCQIDPIITSHRDSLKTRIDFFTKTLNDRQDCIAIQNMDAVQLVQKIEGLTNQIQELQNTNQFLLGECERLQRECRTSQEAVQTLNFLNQEAHQENTNLQNKINRLNVLQSQTAEQLQRLQIELNRRQNLNPQRDSLQGDQQLVILQKKLLEKPLRSKYALTNEIELRNAILNIQGVEGVQNAHEIDQSSWSEYAKRYNELETASDIVLKGFSRALEEVFELSKKEDKKIRLNKSPGTPKHAGKVVYRFLALELLKGGYLLCDCSGNPELILNNKGVKMVYPNPRWIWDGNNNFTKRLSFQYRDDFTPGEVELEATCAAFGPDPITAKLLLVKLSKEDEDHLFNLLMEPVIDDNHPDYVNTLKKINQMSTDKKNEMNGLSDLIINMGLVLEKKFDKLVSGQWNSYLDTENYDLQPIKKLENKVEVKPVEIEELQSHELIPWQIKSNNFVMKNDVAKSDFLNIMCEAQQDYQVYFRHLSSDLLLKPMKKGFEISSVTFEHIDNQYYRCHDYITSHGCLFSSLLSALMVNGKDITSENICKLKNAMANYLDNKDHADIFREALKNDYNLSVEEYQGWLRKEPNYMRLKMNKYNFTPTQIEIAAFTVGVRFCLFVPKVGPSDLIETKCVVDEIGRLRPSEGVEGYYFGPPTKEIFFMALKNGRTYYSLFPKLNLDLYHIQRLNINETDLEVLKKLEQAWSKERHSGLF
jgi:hypothetical protein